MKESEHPQLAYRYYTSVTSSCQDPYQERRYPKQIITNLEKDL